MNGTWSGAIRQPRLPIEIWLCGTPTAGRILSERIKSNGAEFPDFAQAIRTSHH